MWSAEALAERLPKESGRRSVELIVVLSLCGLGISLYLGLFQIKLLGSVWDPAFGSASSAHVLRSTFSRSLPFPDSFAGAAAYFMEVALGAVVIARRQWTELIVAPLLGLLALAMALGSLMLVCVQAFWVHHFCLLCLGSAGISFLNAGLARREEFRAAADGVRIYRLVAHGSN